MRAHGHRKVGAARYHSGVEEEMTTKDGAAAESYPGGDETDGAPRRPDGSYPLVGLPSKLKDIMIDLDE
jgi:hypothetical protein